jgi:hypothetical protein
MVQKKMTNDREVENLNNLIRIGEELLCSQSVDEKKIQNWISEVKSTLPRGCLGRISRLVFILEDYNSFGDPIIYYNLVDIKTVLNFLKDHLYALSASSRDDNVMYLLRIISARENNPGFELGLAERICGDNELFPYRTSTDLTNFFHDLGYSFTHNGQTRKYWVQDQLAQLRGEQLLTLIQYGLFNQKYYSASLLRGKSVVNYDLQAALEDFQNFLLASSQQDEPLRLEVIFNSTAISDLFFKPLDQTRDSQLNSILTESKDLFRQNKLNLALEKLWDGFERLKTLLVADKKAGSKLLVSRICNDIETERVEKEMEELTSIGNSYQIRHHEVNKIPLSTDVEVTYLYFRMLALINYALESLRIMNTFG